MLKIIRRAFCGLLHGHRHAIVHRDGRWVCACGAETKANTDEALA